MSAIQQRARNSSALGLEKLLVLAVVALMVMVGAMFVVSQVGGSASQIRDCLSSPTACAGTGHAGR